MNLDIHKDIINKLDYFIHSNKIPNIIFHGPNGGGKRTLVNDFIRKIYKSDKEMLKAYVMNVNCAHGKGIKFVREDVKFFAKTHLNLNGQGHFKTIVLSNADKLTIDAQSALRRCIEQFSHTTRFFIIVENRYKLLRPILSRFCEIFVQQPIVDGHIVNLHNYKCKFCFSFDNNNLRRTKWLKKYLDDLVLTNYVKLCETALLLYEKGFSGLDIMTYLECANVNEKQKYQFLLAFHKVKREIRSEKLLIMFMLNFVLFRFDADLENISFM